MMLKPGSLAAVGLLACLSSATFAETPDFMGSWATDASCPPHDIVTYGAKAVESDFMNCEYRSIKATGEESWNVQAECLYEGAVNTVSIDLKMSGDRLHEDMAGQPAKELVRCGGDDSVVSIATPSEQGGALPLAHGIYVDVETLCAEADNSSRISFWGDQLNSAHIVGHIHDVIAQDNFFRVTVDLEGDSGMGGNVRERTEWKITTKGQEAFTLKTEYGISSYRWCAASM